MTGPTPHPDDPQPGLFAVLAGACLGGIIAVAVITVFGLSLWWLLAGWVFAIGVGILFGRFATRGERR